MQACHLRFLPRFREAFSKHFHVLFILPFVTRCLIYIDPQNATTRPTLQRSNIPEESDAVPPLHPTSLNPQYLPCTTSIEIEEKNKAKRIFIHFLCGGRGKNTHLKLTLVQRWSGERGTAVPGFSSRSTFQPIVEGACTPTPPATAATTTTVGTVAPALYLFPRLIFSSCRSPCPKKKKNVICAHHVTTFVAVERAARFESYPARRKRMRNVTRKRKQKKREEAEKYREARVRTPK